MRANMVMGFLAVGIAAGLVGWAIAPRKTPLTAGKGNANSIEYRTVRLRVDNCDGAGIPTITVTPNVLSMVSDRKVAWIIPGRKLDDGIEWKIIAKDANKKWFHGGKDMVVSGSNGTSLNNAYLTDPPAVSHGSCPGTANNPFPCVWKYRLEVSQNGTLCAELDPQIRIRDYG